MLAEAASGCADYSKWYLREMSFFLLGVGGWMSPVDWSKLLMNLRQEKWINFSRTEVAWPGCCRCLNPDSRMQTRADSKGSHPFLLLPIPFWRTEGEEGGFSWSWEVMVDFRKCYYGWLLCKPREGSSILMPGSPNVQRISEPELMVPFQPLRLCLQP